MNERLEGLNKQKSRLQVFSLVTMILILSALCALFFNYAVGIGLFLLAMVMYITGLRKQKKQYKKNLKKAILEESFKKHLRDVVYLDRDGIEKSEVEQSGFIPVEKLESMLIKDTVKGTYQNCPVTVGEVTVNFHSVKKDKNGEDKEFIDYLSGVYFDLRLAKSTGRKLMLWNKEAMADAAFERFYGDYKKCECDLQGVTPITKQLMEKYDLYIPVDKDPIEGEEILLQEEKLLKAFYYLADYTPGQPALQLDGDHLRIFVRTRFLYTIEIPVRTEINQKLLTYLDFSELTYLLRVADTKIL